MQVFVRRGLATRRTHNQPVKDTLRCRSGLERFFRLPRVEGRCIRHQNDVSLNYPTWENDISATTEMARSIVQTDRMKWLDRHRNNQAACLWEGMSWTRFAVRSCWGSHRFFEKHTIA